MLDEMTCRQKASNSIFSLNEFAGHHRGKKFKDFNVLQRSELIFKKMASNLLFLILLYFKKIY